MRPALPLAALLLLAAGCTRPAGDAQADETPTLVTPDWLQGRLPPEDAGTPHPGGTLTVRVDTALAPGGIRPLEVDEPEHEGRALLFGTVYETLMEVDRTQHPSYPLRPLLAESHQASADLTVHTFKLRAGVRFQGGEPFGAQALKATLELLASSRSPSRRARARLSELASVQAPDDRTLIVRFKRPDHAAFRFIATRVPALGPSAPEAPPRGTGPFQLVSSEVPDALTLERNDTYWGARPSLDRIILRHIPNPKEALRLLKQGAFDLFLQLTPDAWERLERARWATRGYHRVRFAKPGYGWMGWNQQRPLFRDRRVRLALAKLAPAALEPPSDCPYGPEAPGCDPALPRMTRDLDGARALLSQAGFGDSNQDGVLDRQGTVFKFTFLVPARSQAWAKLAPQIQKAFKEAGIEMELERLDWPEYLERLRRHRFDAGALVWEHRDVDVDLLPVFHCSQMDALNYVSHCSPELDRLLEQLRGTFDEPARLALQQQIHRALHDDPPYLFLSSPPQLDVVSRRVHGLVPSLLGYDLRGVWLSSAPP